MSDINSIISSLQKINEDKIQEITLPYSKVDITLKPFQAKHNSMVNSSLVAGGDGTYALKFSSLLKDIFDDLIIIKNGKTYLDIPLIDVHYIVLRIRKTFSNTVSIDIGTEEEQTIDINDIISKFENTETKITEGVCEDKSKQIKIYIKQPSFLVNLEYDKIITASHKKFGDKNSEIMIKDALAYTVLKFIQKMDITVENEIQTIFMNTISPKDRITLLNSIDNIMYKDLMDKVSELTNPIDDLLKVDGEYSLAMDQRILMDN